MLKIAKNGYIVAMHHEIHRGLPYETTKFWFLLKNSALSQSF